MLLLGRPARHRRERLAGVALEDEELPFFVA